MKKMLLEIFTPEKSVLKEYVQSIIVPSYEGEMGILPEHIPLIAQLVPGEIKILSNNERKIFVISGGFIEVNTAGVEIYAETADLLQEIDIEKSKIELEQAKSKLKQKDIHTVELLKAKFAIQKELAKIKVISRHKHH